VTNDNATMVLMLFTIT